MNRNGVGCVTIVECADNESACGTGISSDLDNDRCRIFASCRIVAPMRFAVFDWRALRVVASARQHFLKPEAVFFDVLVYSGCSASRFPSARSD
jgi:hypothetical protein